MAKKVIPEVAEAFGADPDELAEAVETPAPVAAPAPPAPVAAAPVAPAQPITLTLDQLQALLANAHLPPPNTMGLAEAITKGMESVREPRPENKFSPEISWLNPLGEKDHPRPGLKCDFYLGTQDGKSGQVFRTYPFEAGDLSAYEQIALNTLQPASAVIKRLDEAPMPVQVVAATRDKVTDEITRMVIVVPTDLIAKGSQIKNMIPSLTSIVAQITGRDFSKLSNDDLAWFMKEHRAKRYVSERDSVAA